MHDLIGTLLDSISWHSGCGFSQSSASAISHGRPLACPQPASRDLILIDDDTPQNIIQMLKREFPKNATVVSGYSRQQVQREKDAWNGQ